MKKSISLLVALFLSVVLLAQSPVQKADLAFKSENYLDAISFYQKALVKEKNDENKKIINFQIAESYRLSNNFRNAGEWYQKALDAGYKESAVYVGYGDVLMKNGDYNQAKGMYQEFLKLNPGDRLVKVKLQSCSFIETISTEQPFYTIENVQALNSQYSDYGIAYFKDQFILSSARLNNANGKQDPLTMQGFSDIYNSSMEKESMKWGKPVALDGYVNSQFNEGTFSYCVKNNTAYYMQCNGVNGKKSNCNIFSTQYNDLNKSWGKPELFPFNSKSFSVGHPSINEEGNVLYFVSDMPGGEGGKDIYRIKKTGDSWGTPENIGSVVNTPGDEMFPFISGDTLLVFASNGHVGMGSLDIFISKINKNGAFSTPENILPPFNSTADDFGLMFNQSGLKEGYFCSNRVQGSVGDDDVYSFSKIAIVFNASGVVLNRKDNTPIKNARVTYTAKDGRIDSTYTDKNGAYSFNNIRINMEYVMKAEKNGFFADSKGFTLENQKYSHDFNTATGKDLDITLLPITKEEVEISDIYYDYNSAALRDISKVELDKLVKMLTETPNVVIVLNSHTDVRGNDKYNIKLSQRRAQSVVDYLISKGIDSKRLSAKGWGETRLVVKNAKTEEEHQKNRRTTFNVVNADQLKVSEETTGVVFSLQFAAPKEPLENSKIEDFKAILPGQQVKSAKGDDGFIRYTIGIYKSYEEASQGRDKIIAAGKEAFVVAFLDGEKISVNEAKNLTKAK